MKSRHRARESALQFIYQTDLSTQGQAYAGKTAGEIAPLLIKDLQKHFDHFQVDAGVREYAALLASGTLTHLQPLDEILEKHASNWKVARMAAVDRSLLRLATYEMLYLPEVPPSVVIDEAIELGKAFGTAETPSFVNGILDAVRKSIESGSLKVQ